MTEPARPPDRAYLEALSRRVEELERIEKAARALYERVQMDESVGICLSERVTTLNLGEKLGPVF